VKAKLYTIWDKILFEAFNDFADHSLISLPSEP